MTKVHIVTRDDWDHGEDVAVVVAECGAVGLIMPDGKLVPDTFDFISHRSAEQADCEPCKRELRARHDWALRCVLHGAKAGLGKA